MALYLQGFRPEGASAQNNHATFKGLSRFHSDLWQMENYLTHLLDFTFPIPNFVNSIREPFQFSGIDPRLRLRCKFLEI